MITPVSELDIELFTIHDEDELRIGLRMLRVNKLRLAIFIGV
jgi:hypothetical protein